MHGIDQNWKRLKQTFVEDLQLQSTLSKTDIIAEIGTHNSVPLREMLKRESDKGSKGGQGPTLLRYCMELTKLEAPQTNFC